MKFANSVVSVNLYMSVILFVASFAYLNFLKSKKSLESKKTLF